MFVRDWVADGLTSQLEPLLKTKRDIQRGKALFRETGCVAYHLYRGEGKAVGPAQTLMGHRLTVRGIIESMTEPGKVISDQYGTTAVTLKNGAF